MADPERENFELRFYAPMPSRSSYSWPLSGTPRGAESSIKLDRKKQLFLDDYFISSASNVSRQLHPAQKYSGNPVLWSDETWENGFVSLYGSVLEDEGKYRLWYQSGLGVSYAESQDGIKWIKPRLELVKYAGQATNGLAVSATAAAKGLIELSSDSCALPYFYEMFGVLKDPQEKDASRRYKLGFLSVDFEYRGPRPDPFHEGQRRGLGVAGSPDGIHWKLIDNWTTGAICDGGSHWTFDSARSKYVLYGRTKFISPSVAEGWGLKGMPTMPMSPATQAWVKANYWGRSVARLESSDFLHWDFTDPGTAPVVMAADLQDSRPGTEIYDMMVFPYESLYVGLVKVWHRTPEGGPLEIELAVSHDTYNFTRVADRSSLIPVGPIGDWDRFTNSIPTNPPLVVGDTLRFYYSGGTSRHGPYSGKDSSKIGCGIGFATVQLDRFVSLAASFDGGQIVSKPLDIKGKVLHLNAKADFGEILVEVLDMGGRTVAESDPIQQDALDIAVQWRQGSLSGSSPVRVKITLKNAHLYAIWST